MARKTILVAAGALALIGAASTSQAALSASASLGLVSTGGTPANPTYTYSISLKSNGTTTVGSFWYAWIPGQDYMHTAPISIVNPTGWHSTVTGGGATDGFAIQWAANSSASYIASGSTLSTFAFTSADDLNSLAGFSTFFPTKRVGTSVVYSGGIFSDLGFTFLVNTVVPEPAGPISAVLLVGAALLGRHRVA